MVLFKASTDRLHGLLQQLLDNTPGPLVPTPAVQHWHNNRQPPGCHISVTAAAAVTL